MNIFIPLVAGIIAGYTLRGKLKYNLDKPMSATLLFLIFFMGVEAGRVEIEVMSLFVTSIIFAFFTILGSLFFSLLLGGKLK